MTENFEFNLGNLKIEQLSYVYKDIKKQAKIMEQLYGIPTFAQMEDIVHQEATYRGKPIPDDFEVISSFRVRQGSGPHWAHPVIHDGILYIRHGDVLMAYDISDRK